MTKEIAGVVMALICSILATGQEINLLEFARHSDVYNVEILPAAGINSPGLEFSPIYYRDGLVYVYSDPKRSKLRDKEINSPAFALYFASFNSEGMPEKPMLFSTSIASDFHLGPASFNKAQDKIFFSRNDIPEVIPKARKGKEAFRAVQKLYQADLGPEQWINIEKLGFNSDSFYVFHPSVATDSRRIYFSSNMPGGFGDADIYYIELIGNSWSPPINAGPEINTAGKEAYPFIHPNGDLYFASNGHVGEGGFDLFVSRPQGRKWSKPINLGAPINTRYDDFGICIAPNGFEGFFTSNRPGGKGKDDIYKFKVKLKENLPYYQWQLIAVDKAERQRLEGVGVNLFELVSSGLPGASDPFYADKDPVNNRTTFSLKSDYKLKVPDQVTDAQGTVIFDLYKNKRYAVVLQMEGYKPLVSSIDPGMQELKIEMERIPTKKCFWMHGLVIDKDSRSQLKDVAIAVIDKRTKEGPAFKTTESGLFIFCADNNIHYEVHLSKAGYNPASVPFKLNQNQTDTIIDITFELEKVSVFKEKAEVEEGKTIILNNIYYDYNQFSIRKDATRELDDLAALMQEKSSMEIELIAHTDSRGDWLYNQKLSLQRAIAAKDYLVSKGILEARIKALGYGESQIRNHCFDGVPCSEEDHQFNRRTEVRIIKMNGKSVIGDN
jgi:outer membrane protein OmpA-like peptidoglycan-associated protein